MVFNNPLFKSTVGSQSTISIAFVISGFLLWDHLEVDL